MSCVRYPRPDRRSCSCSRPRFPKSRTRSATSPTHGTSNGVRRKLLHLAESYGRVVGDGIRIDFPVSHTLLADMIGSSRETVTRALYELQRRGFVPAAVTPTGC